MGIESALAEQHCLMVSTSKSYLLLEHLNALMVSSGIVILFSAVSLTLHHLLLQEAVESGDLLLEQIGAPRC